MRNREKFTLIIGVSFTLLSIICLFVPFQKTETIMPELDYGIVEGNKLYYHFEYPWRSIDQKIIIELNASKGKISLIIMDESAFTHYLLKNHYDPYFQSFNFTQIKKELMILPPNQDELTIIIIIEEDTDLNGSIETQYLYYYSNYGIFFLIIVSIIIAYYTYHRYIKR